MKPLFTVVKGADSVANGDYSITIASSKKDEIGQLTDSFNQMTSALDITFKENMDYRQNLELKVQQRTAEVLKGKEDPRYSQQYR